MAKKSHSNHPIEGDNDQELIVVPGAVKDEDHHEEETAIPAEVAILPVRNMVIFPGMVVPLAIAREKSQVLISSVLPDQKIIATVCQKDSEVNDPTPEDLFEVATAVSLLKLIRLEDEQQGVIVHGVSRVRIVEWLQKEPYFRARIEPIPTVHEATTRNEALEMNVRQLANKVIDLAPSIPEEAHSLLSNLEGPGPLTDFLAANLQLDIETRQELLSQPDVSKRMTRVAEELQRQIEVLELSGEIQSQVRQKIDKTQREYYLQEQLKAIQKELGQADERGAEIEELRQKLKDVGMPEKIEEDALRDLDRMSKMPEAAAEYNVLRTYLEVMGELPWSTMSEGEIDVQKARRILDEDHYDLDKVKKRIIEYLAVRKLAPSSRGPILCFVGPPGVGKTSLGQSIARSLGRKFIRMSLGGMRDEAELRGHRRTYIGAMPGRIIQEIRKAGTRNPVFMLDELDKVGQDFRGDPTSALLEILDPAQNNTFQDHYLGVPFDLSDVIFIATANYIGAVPAPLRDRMEVIDLPGYTQEEKVHIAEKYLVKRQRKENGLKSTQIKFPRKALREIIDRYTREAGVRELERQIGAICRGLAAMIAEGQARSRTVNHKFITEILGPARYESELAMRTSTPGVATGLAYTPVGGTIIFVEATSYPGKGGLMLTGQIGDVMKESAQTALSLVKSRIQELGVERSAISGRDLHVHVPAGAIPKDGPSAGVAMFTALTSLMTGKTPRADVAMTGEITLRGIVLPVGGIKEKVLAASRAGIREVVLPERNRKDLADVPEEARKKLEFHFAKSAEDVLEVALSNGKASSSKKCRKSKSS
ncbi:MAG: endopeptidase La [Phycisphaerae bacterium]